MRIAVITGSGPWAGDPAVAAAVSQAWASQGHVAAVVARPPAPVRPRRRLVPVPGRTALCLAGEDLAPDPLAERLAGADLAVGLFEVLEFRDGGGPELARLSDAAAAAAIPLVVLSSRLDVSARELRVLGVEAAYALDPADSAVVLERLARTWSW